GRTSAWRASCRKPGSAMREGLPATRRRRRRGGAADGMPVAAPSRQPAATMLEHLLHVLPEPARAARALYDPPTGGYHLPPRHEHRPLTMADVPKCREVHTRVQYHCVEAPVAALLY